MRIVVTSVAALLAALLGGVVAFTLAAAFGAARHRRRHPPSCPADADEEPLPWPARALATTYLLARESMVNLLLCLTVPLPVRNGRAAVTPAGDDRRPVVLVHGYAQNPALLLWLARALRRDGWRSCHLVRHRPLWGDLAANAAHLRTAIDTICRETGAPAVDIVAHSMGGLVARACIRTSGATGVARLITLGTPHQGTEAFRGWTPDPMVAQMRPESTFLRTLATDDPVPALVDCISIFSADDALVLPPRHAYYPGAFNIEVRGLGHLSLMFSRRVYDLVRENLAAELVQRVEAT